MCFFFQAEDGIRDLIVTEFRRVLFRSRGSRARGVRGLSRAARPRRLPHGRSVEHPATHRDGRRMSGPQGPSEPQVPAPRPIDPHVRVGHVHLRTADIDRVREFYVGVLGFDVIHEARGVPGWGTTGDVLFVSAGGYHHHLGFNTWRSGGGGPQPDGVAGLHHVALSFSTKATLADAVQRLVDVDWPLRQLTDHGTHLAVYLSDPDGNDLELAWDRPFDEWPRPGEER